MDEGDDDAAEVVDVAPRIVRLDGGQALMKIPCVGVLIFDDDSRLVRRRGGQKRQNAEEQGGEKRTDGY